MGARLEDAGTVDGAPVGRAILENANGLRAVVCGLGATLQSLAVPDRSGRLIDLALGFDTAIEYTQKSGHLGATAGRFANRIAHGRFDLDGRSFTLPLNEGGKHHLHGGPRGFGKRPWQIELAGGSTSVRCALHSPDGDNGYPGALDASCTYSLQDDNILLIEMTAVTTAPTPINLVNHTYWNMAGTGTVYAQTLEVDADQVLEFDADTMPTGRILRVADTSLDFRAARAIGPDGEPYLDNCFLLRPQSGVRFVARLGDPDSGRAMEVWANQPGVQVYSGFKLATTGRGGAVYGPGAGLCLETEALPDAPNQPHFPSAILRPGETYRHVMEHRFKLGD